MSMKRLTGILVDGLKELGIISNPTENRKNNGVVRHGLTLRRGDERVCPIFYLDCFYEKYKSGELSAEDILQQIIVEYEKTPTPTVPDLDELMSSPDFISKIKLRVVNATKNREMISSRELVYHDIPNTDLVALFYFACIEDENTTGCTAVTETIMKRYLPDIDDGDVLFENIVNHPQSDIRIESIVEIIKKMTENDLPLMSAKEDFLFVVTNQRMSYGAGNILTISAREKLKERFPSGYLTILPSSVHEMLVLEHKEDENIEALKDMVYTVNRNEVSEEDYLSDNVFHYDVDTGELTIAE